MENVKESYVITLHYYRRKTVENETKRKYYDAGRDGLFRPGFLFILFN